MQPCQHIWEDREDRIILLFLLLQSSFSKYNGCNIGPVYSTCCGCGCSQKTLSLDQTNWEIGKQNVIVSFEWHHFEMTCLWHALNWPYTQVFTFYGLWSVFIRTHIVILVFRDEMETLENHFLWSSEKKWSLLSSRIPGIENSCWTLLGIESFWKSQSRLYDCIGGIGQS